MILEEKLDRILQDLELIKKNLNIVPDLDTTIKDDKSSIEQYKIFAKEELKLNEKTITNQLSTISRFLSHSKGVVNKESVQEFFDSNDSDSWKSNQLKVLRRYCRDFLKLGNWINEFKFSKTQVGIKNLPDEDTLFKLFALLPTQTLVITLILYTSGLRIGEVLSLEYRHIQNDMNMIDASKIHEGETKHSWISFVNQETMNFLNQYLDEISFDYEDNLKLFTTSSRVVQKDFEKSSEQIGFKINPHMLRKIFTEKCTQAGIKDKYIDALCGRISKSVIAKHYTDYSPDSLKREYKKVEPLLAFDLN